MPFSFQFDPTKDAPVRLSYARFQPARPGISRVATFALAALVAVAGIASPFTSVMAQEKLTPGGGSAVAGQSTEPVVVVTLGSIDQLTRDLNYLSGAIGQPQLGGMFAMMAGTFTQGIDTSQPVGVVVPLIDGAPEPIALLPTSNVKTVLKRMEAQVGPADELDDGTMVIAIGANTVFIRQVGNWAVLARNRSVLDRAPADPSAIISEMGTDYDIAVRLDVQQIPPPMRDALIGQIRQGFDQAMKQQQNGDEAALEYAAQSIEQLEQVIDQTKELMIGIDIDSANRRIMLETEFTAVAGTKLARIYDGQKPIPSAYSSVIREDAAGYVHFASSIGPEALEQAQTSVDGAMQMLGSALSQTDKLSESEQAEATDMIRRVVELMMDSAKEGKSDFGALLLTDANKLQFAMGAFVSDGGEAASIVKDVAAKVQGRGDAPRFEFDVNNYKGVNMHLVEADVPADEDEVRKIFGEQVRVHIGTGPKAIYVALGDDSLPLMKQLIDAEATPVAPSGNTLMQLEVNLMPILQFAQSIENNDAIAAMIDALSRADDAGELRIVSEAIENGQISRFIIGDGMLQAIGAAARQAQQAKMNQGF
ncbi:putative signal peptide and transmembrane protein [Rhodopirellula islandica]|uniref:Signal peptide and transmembrane protein n=1 Tax=Rhodopirellula islandica TaxID=595434 RepID=A0A0J1BI22_RHOIS|nr:putative signal peptide and transmembrane protein [Rhodopirellula islandica]